MKAKPWQIALIAVGLLIGVASIMYNAVRSSSGEASLVYSMTLVDAETGKLYEVADYREARITLPEWRPTTEKAALIPVQRQEDGRYVVPAQARPMLQSLDVPVKVIDRETGVASVTGEPERFTR